jgi:Bacterial conjugation TrbI-like protein
MAVIEYNYERDGEIVVPAGTKAIGHIQDANRSGYVDIQFDTLLMPDGASVPIAAAATGLDLRPLKGKVEGKNTGKNIVVRSLSGIGQAGSMIIAQNSLNQPLNESDLIRERVSSNIGEAGDEEVSRPATSQRIVVTVPAGVPIYVVLEQSARSMSQAGSGNQHSQETSTNIEQLQQLLRLQQELTDTERLQSTQ